MKPALKPLRPAARRRQHGLALLEAMIAVVILAIGLIGTIGLQARAYAALNDAGMRAEATMAADKLLGTISADAGNIGNYGLVDGAAPNTTMQPWAAETRVRIPNAKIAVTIVPQVRRTQVTINIRWSHKTGGPENRHVIVAYIEA